MELSNEFVVPTGIDAAWAVLTDVERIAPCLPGASLEAVDGEDFKGAVKVKVGPVTVEYKGTARFIELDETAHKAVLKAQGRETRGQGNATATVTAQLTPDGTSTKVAVLTELDITGRVAQFGRGMLADVSTRLLGQFVDRLERDVLGAAAEPSADSGAAPSADGDLGASIGGAGTGEQDDNTLDLGKLVGKTMLVKLAAPFVALAAALALLLRRRRRRRS